MSESIQKKLLRVRPPRVRITYDVHTNGAIEKRELPFVVGIFADLSGDRDPLATTPVPPEYKERKIVEIDRDNFNDVMARIQPGLNIRVKNTLAGDDSEMAVGLKFRSIEDFEPARVAEQVPALKAMLETRAKLRDLMSKVDRSDELEGLLEQVLQDKDKLDKLSAELGLDKKEG